MQTRRKAFRIRTEGMGRTSDQLPERQHALVWRLRRASSGSDGGATQDRRRRQELEGFPLAERPEAARTKSRESRRDSKQSCGSRRGQHRVLIGGPFKAQTFPRAARPRDLAPLLCRNDRSSPPFQPWHSFSTTVIELSVPLFTRSCYPANSPSLDPLINEELRGRHGPAPTDQRSTYPTASIPFSCRQPAQPARTPHVTSRFPCKRSAVPARRKSAIGHSRLVHPRPLPELQ